MIQVSRTIAIDERELEFHFIRSSGPGGQNVNKVATAVQLRFDVVRSRSLPDEVRDRLIALGGRRVNENGELVIEARRFRTQERNRQDAIDRLVELIGKAAVRPKARHKTAPSRAARERRLAEKRLRGDAKRKRRRVDEDPG